ncbi:hypothetical protein ABZX40_40565 [Streptomyces sp. NPDC004610]|uniref:hypothetical protein n=1 Tax=unclassified Streptomyces TaxID=2593676 RepID=UPI0033A59E3A
MPSAPGGSPTGNGNTFAASPDGMKNGSGQTEQLTDAIKTLLSGYDKSKVYPDKPSFGDPDDEVVQAVIKVYNPIRDGIEEGLDGTVGALLKSAGMVRTSAGNFETEQDQNISDISKSGRH